MTREIQGTRENYETLLCAVCGHTMGDHELVGLDNTVGKCKFSSTCYGYICRCPFFRPGEKRTAPPAQEAAKGEEVDKSATCRCGHKMLQHRFENPEASRYCQLGCGCVRFRPAEADTDGMAAGPKPESKTVCQEADELTRDGGERRKDYGGVVDFGRRAAMAWSAILNSEVTPEQVYLCMIAYKAVREANAPKRDNLVDVCGYARVIEIYRDEVKDE